MATRRYTDPNKWPRDHAAKHSAAAKKGWKTRTGGYTNPKTRAEYAQFRKRTVAAAAEAKADAKRRNAGTKTQQEKELQEEYRREASRRLRRDINTAEGNMRASRTAADRKRFKAEAENLQAEYERVQKGGHTHYVNWLQFRRNEIHAYSYKYSALKG